MQCVNCGFENMPGISTCARCASSLMLADISINPPRASRSRASTRIRRVFHPIWSRLTRLSLSGRRLRLLMPEPVSLPALAWTIIPGLGHLRIRQPRLGWSLLCIWLTLLLLAIFSLGAFWHSFFWSGAIVTHGVAFVSLFAASLGYERFLMRALFGAVVFAALHFLLYRPITQAASSLYVLLPVQRIGANEVVTRGDVLLREGAWMRPELFNRGDLVAYRIHEIQNGGYYIREGLNFDRVIGTPGDHVQAIDGALLVNGAPLDRDCRPLAGSPFENFELTVSPGHYLILPSSAGAWIPETPGWNRTAPQQLLMSISVVNHDDVLGRIVFRLRPLRRIGSVR